MNSKLLINLHNGTLEVEGSEDLIKEIYSDFKHLLADADSSKKQDESGDKKPVDQIIKKQTANKKKSSSTKSHSSPKPKSSGDPKMLTTLNLRPKGKMALKDYAAKYSIKTTEELSLLIVYYLIEELKEKVSIDHIYTCYKELGKKIPQHLRQTLINQKNNKNYIDINDWDDIKFTIPGMNHMEHDIAKADGKSK